MDAALVVSAEHLPPERHPVVIYLAGLQSLAGRRSQTSALRTIASRFFEVSDWQDVPWWKLRYEHVIGLRAWLVEQDYAPATASRMLCAVKCVLRESWRIGLIGEEDYRRITSVPSVRGSRELAGRRVPTGDVRALFAACDPTDVVQVRDAALLGVLFGCGLRRTELVTLDRSSFDGHALRFVGKGNKERIVPIPPGARRALAAWLAMRGDDEGPLICPTEGGEIILRRLTVEGATAALRRCAKRAGVEKFSPHDLRRSYGTAMLEAGADLGTVQDLMGHASPVTTRRYDRRDERARDAAAAAFDVPYLDAPEA